MPLLAFLFAALIGLSLGLLGGGGSILTVPIFVYVLGFEPKQAIGMSLAVVAATSFIGAAGHWRAGTLNPRLALTFGAIAMGGSFGGARLASYLSGAVQLLLFAVVMLAASFFMFRDRRPAPSPGLEAGHRPIVLLVLAALGVGLLTGLAGVGGGFLIVPALVLLARVPMKQAVGSSLLVIAMNGAVGFVGYLGQIQVDWGLMALFTLVAAGGILLGTALVRFVSPRALRRAFALFLLAMALFILYQSHSSLSPG